MLDREWTDEVLANFRRYSVMMARWSLVRALMVGALLAECKLLMSDIIRRQWTESLMSRYNPNGMDADFGA